MLEKHATFDTLSNSQQCLITWLTLLPQVTVNTSAQRLGAVWCLVGCDFAAFLGISRILAYHTCLVASDIVVRKGIRTRAYNDCVAVKLYSRRLGYYQRASDEDISPSLTCTIISEIPTLLQ